MMNDARFQFATNQACLTSSAAPNFVPVSAILSSVGSGRPVYVMIRITEAITVTTPAVDRSQVRFALILSNSAGSVVQRLAESVAIYDIGQDLGGGLVLNPVGRLDSLFAIAIPPLSRSQMEHIKAFASTTPLAELRLLHTITNEAGAGPITGKYSASLVFDFKSGVSTEMLADAVN